MFAVNVRLSSKSTSGFGWHDCYRTYAYVRTWLCTYVYLYIFYLLQLVQDKWCVALSVMMKHQFQCFCSSLPTEGVDGYLDYSSLWPSHCSTDTS